MNDATRTGMGENMLSTLLEMSLAGGCLILVVIVLRALLLHRLPKALFFWL